MIALVKGVADRFIPDAERVSDLMNAQPVLAAQSLTCCGLALKIIMDEPVLMTFAGTFVAKIGVAAGPSLTSPVRWCAPRRPSCRCISRAPCRLTLMTSRRRRASR